jgi:hypothetical protein
VLPKCVFVTIEFGLGLVVTPKWTSYIGDTKMSTRRRIRKRGRPATGRDPVITVRLTPQLQRALALLSERHGMTRSAAIRGLLNAGLDHAHWIVDPKRNVGYEGDTPGLRRLYRSGVIVPRVRGRELASDPVNTALQIAKREKKKQKQEAAGWRRVLGLGPRNIKLT